MTSISTSTNFLKVLTFDPSGNFDEGQGTTGWNLMVVSEEHPKGKPIGVGQIRAVEFDSRFDYWQSHMNLIATMQPDVVVIEDFRLYANKAQQQTNSRMPTPKLIGVMEFWLHQQKIPYFLQGASEAKTRWTDDRLLKKGYVSKTGNRYYACGVSISKHVRDSIRHAVHFIHFKLPKIRS